MTDVETPPEVNPEPPVDEVPPYQPDPPTDIEWEEPVYGDPDYEEPPRPIDDPEIAAKLEAAREAGITGDPDAEPGYWVDENYRPNPLDVGSFVTTDHAYNDPNDLTQHSGLFANAGVHPDDIEQWPSEPDQAPPEEVPPGPDHPEPAQAGATDYDPSLTATPRGRAADPAQQTLQQTEGAAGRREAEEVQASAEKTAQAAEKTVEKATHATKKATKASPAGTKDTALEDPA